MSKQVMKLLGLFSFFALGSTVLFNNCHGANNGQMGEEELLSVDCGSNCVNGTHPDQYKVDNISGETLDVRQTVESYMSLLELKVSDLTSSDLSSLVAESKRRMALLPQESDSSLVSSVAILSQASIAGEVCRIWVYQKATNSSLATGVNLKEPVSATPKNNWINLFNKMAEQSWGRPLDSGELQDVSSFVDEAMISAAKSAATKTTLNKLNLESANLATLICTGVLASPESTML